MQDESAVVNQSRHHNSDDRYTPAVPQKYRHTQRQGLTPGRILPAFRTTTPVQPLRPEESHRLAYFDIQADQATHSVANVKLNSQRQAPFACSRSGNTLGNKGLNIQFRTRNLEGRSLFVTSNLDIPCSKLDIQQSCTKSLAQTTRHSTEQSPLPQTQAASPARPESHEPQQQPSPERSARTFR